MNKYLKLYESHSQYVNPEIKPNVSYCRQENEVHYNPRTWADEYFTTVACEDGTISFNIRFDMGTDMITSISYSTDNGETWTTTNNTDNKTVNLVIDVTVNNGDKVMWKGDATQTGCWSPNEDVNYMVGSFFSSTCEFDAQGNVMSLLYGDGFRNKTTIEKDYAFAFLFCDFGNEKTCSIANAKNLSLPATTLADYCYFTMFGGCTSLTTAPSVLPATTLAQGCYISMFGGCTSLTTAPELPATTLAEYCYSIMFNGCSSLTTAPELPSTALAERCYEKMFLDCTSLTTAPELPATTLVSGCYSGMFWGCTSLNYIKAMFTTTPSTTYTSSWVRDIASTGTFVKNAAATWTDVGTYAVPRGWTVETASE